MRYRLHKLFFWMPGFEREAARWLEAETERAAARRHVALAVARSGRYWFWCALLVAAALVAFPFGEMFLRGVFGRFFAVDRWLLNALVLTLYVAASLWSYSWFVGGAQRRLLWKHVVERGVPVCLGCGYDLRGQTEPRCPECGQAFEPAAPQPDAAKA